MNARACPAAIAALALLALAPFAATAPAQAADTAKADPAVAGDLVRLGLLDGPPLTGTLLAWDARSLALRLETTANGDTAARRIPRASITGLDLGRTRGHSGTGALIGLGIGLFGGILIGSSLETHGEYDWRKLGWFVGGPIYGTIGGAITGALIRSEHWVPAALPAE
ncbi:MAG: hypothetical protein ABIP29_10925 [Candidatus Eisenbacteria bacterium]